MEGDPFGTEQILCPYSNSTDGDSELRHTLGEGRPLEFVHVLISLFQ